MRFVLFYSDVESFNYFTDQIVRELQRRNHACFILDLRNTQDGGDHSFAALAGFLQTKADVVIAFDGIGIKEDDFIGLWDAMQTRAVNILMDHPLRFHLSMTRHPKNYVQLCCDRNHVEYVKKYFPDQVKEVAFMPHAGTDAGEIRLDDYEKRPYDILFSGTYYRPQSYLDKIDHEFQGNALLRGFYHDLAAYMIENYSLTTEQAVSDLAEKTGLTVSPGQLKTMFACAEPIDWMARMHYREKVVGEIAKAGLDIWLLGRGWENHPGAGLENFHIISDRVPFLQTFSYMHDAKINLNVMPWFKDGTHDRIFNILLQGSLPFTDASGWLKENFRDGVEIAYYELDQIGRIPEQLRDYLSAPQKAQKIIESGSAVVRQNFVWENIVERILDISHYDNLSFRKL